MREGDLRMWKLLKMEKKAAEVEIRPDGAAYTLNPQLVANSWVQPYVLRQH